MAARGSGQLAGPRPHPAGPRPTIIGLGVGGFAPRAGFEAALGAAKLGQVRAPAGRLPGRTRAF